MTCKIKLLVEITDLTWLYNESLPHWLGDRHPSPNAPRNTTKPQEVNGSYKMVILENETPWNRLQSRLVLRVWPSGSACKTQGVLLEHVSSKLMHKPKSWRDTQWNLTRRLWHSSLKNLCLYSNQNTGFLYLHFKSLKSCCFSDVSL